MAQNILCSDTLVELAIDCNYSQAQGAGEKVRRYQYQISEIFCATVAKECDKYNAKKRL